MRAAPGLLDGGDDADDVLDADPPVVEGDEHPADDVVDRRPLDAVEPLEVAAQGSPDLGLLLGGRCGDLDLHVPVVAPRPGGCARARAARSCPVATSTIRAACPSGTGSEPVTTVPATRAVWTAAVRASPTEPRRARVAGPTSPAPRTTGAAASPAPATPRRTVAPRASRIDGIRPSTLIPRLRVRTCPDRTPAEPAARPVRNGTGRMLSPQATGRAGRIREMLQT